MSSTAATADLRGRRVAVTGAAGFVGAEVCRQLAEAGAEVAALDLRPAPVGEFVECDVTDPAAAAAALRGAELVVHTAAIVTEWGEMDEFVRVNVRGTRNVLDGAEAAGVTRVVHVSSVAVFGAEWRREIHEDEPGRPCGNPYVDTKWASERLARGRGATIVRPGDVYGPGSAQWLIRPVEGLRGRLFRVPGDGAGLITPVYVDDLARCIVLALTHPDAGGQVFAAYERALPAREFFAHHARIAGRGDVPTIPVAVAKATALAEDLLGRVTGRHPTATPFAIRYVQRPAAYHAPRAREVLGWEPQVPLEEGMRRCEEWLRAEGR